MVDLRNCITELENWSEGKAVILRGDGDLFCSGGDLDFAKATGTAEGGLHMSIWMHDILKRFRSLPLVCISFGILTPKIDNSFNVKKRCLSTL